MGSIKPLDKDFLQKCVHRKYVHWITLEEHHESGGLGSCILEWLSEQKIINIKLSRIGVKDHFVHKLGEQSFIRKSEGINVDSIVDLVKSI